MSGSSNRSFGLTVLRIVVGIVFLMHGQQKVFHFGFHGVSGMLGSLGIPLPAAAAAVLMTVEFVGGITLILGLATRVTAVLLAIDMLVAILKVHLPHGFFSPMGFEFPLVLLSALICLALMGPGAASVDGAMGKKTS